MRLTVGTNTPLRPRQKGYIHILKIFALLYGVRVPGVELESETVHRRTLTKPSRA
jgi:hypothetical protein